MNLKRVRQLNNSGGKRGPVVYWMSRDQRVKDNWALIYAAEISKKENTALTVIFCLVPDFLEASMRHYGFMLKGLKEIEAELEDLNISFYILTGDPPEKIPEFLNDVSAGCLVGDFDPLRIKRQWKKDILRKIIIPFYEVDAHNIVPAFVASGKEEFAAYTIRPKIKKLLPEFLEEFPVLKKNTYKISSYNKKNNWDDLINSLMINSQAGEVGWIKPGATEAQKALKEFIFSGLKNYDAERNDPVKKGQSDLSPYLHFGHMAPQRVALNVEKHFPDSNTKEAYLEELIVRRELSDNFCLYNKYYDSFDGFKDWAKNSLNLHRNDKREYVYYLNEFENSNTHEDLWNAAQNELRNRGKMHGYMRMYWAKKILEWSESPEEAMRIAVYLNDKYELDGRDPNGYAGCAWAIGGVHDRAWGERQVFGKIRYMNRNGCKRKFDIEEYIRDNEKLKITN